MANHPIARDIDSAQKEIFYTRTHLISNECEKFACRISLSAEANLYQLGESTIIARITLLLLHGQLMVTLFLG